MKVNSLFFVLLSMVVFTSFAPKHALYLSVMELRNSDQGNLTVKVFTDDLQDALRNYDPRTDLKSFDQFSDLNREILARYFNQNLIIKINGKTTKMILEKIVKETEAHFLYFQIPSEVQWKSVEVNGPYFTELFPAQTNVLTVINNEKKHFTRLTKSQPSYKVIFD